MRFRQELGERLEAFGLKLAEDKTHCIEFGRFARENARKQGGKPKELEVDPRNWTTGEERPWLRIGVVVKVWPLIQRSGSWPSDESHEARRSRRR